jgi:hypothetical protein
MTRGKVDDEKIKILFLKFERRCHSNDRPFYVELRWDIIPHYLVRFRVHKGGGVGQRKMASLELIIVETRRSLENVSFSKFRRLINFYYCFFIAFVLQTQSQVAFSMHINTIKYDFLPAITKKIKPYRTFHQNKGVIQIYL